MKNTLLKVLGIVFSFIPVLIAASDGCTNLVLLIAAVGLFLTRLIVEFDVFRWLISITSLAYIIGGFIGLFLSNGTLEFIAAIIIVCNALPIIDACMNKVLFGK